MQAYATAAGFTGTLQPYAVSGTKVSGVVEQHQLAKVDLAATEGQTIYMAHTGGNNVLGGANTFAADYDTLIANIIATDTLISLLLTKRLYGSADAGYSSNLLDVVQGDPASEENGSLPYNSKIVFPHIAHIAPDWIDASSAPFV